MRIAAPLMAGMLALAAACGGRAPSSNRDAGLDSGFDAGVDAVDVSCPGEVWCNVECLWRQPEQGDAVDHDIAPVLGERWLTAVRFGVGLVRFDYDGALSVLFSFEEALAVNEAGLRLIPHPLGDVYGVLWFGDLRLQLFTLEGEVVGEFDADNHGYGLVPRSRRLLDVVWVQATLEDGYYDRIDVVEPDGRARTLLSREALGDLQSYRLSGDGNALVITRRDPGSGSSWVDRFDLDHGLTWSQERGLGKVAVSDDGTVIVGVEGAERSTFVQLSGLDELGQTELSGVIWDTRVSPSGRYAAATAVDSVALLDRGVERFHEATGWRYTVNLDVSDLGEVLVSGHFEDDRNQVRLQNADGDRLWEAETEPDTQGYRPWPRFVFDTDHFYVRTRDWLTLYRIVGRDPACFVP